MDLSETVLINFDMKYLFFLMFSIHLIGQNTQSFSLLGHTNLKTENVWLIQPFGESYSFFELKNGFQKIVDKNGNFSFEGSLNIPTLFLIATDTYVSSDFFLENNTQQKINYSEDEPSKKIKLTITGSTSNEEYIKIKEKFKESFVKDSLGTKKVNSGIEDYIIFDYIKKNPDSYVALWLLIKKFSDNKPNIYQNEALSYFSNSIKSSDLYKNFTNKIVEVRFNQNDIKNGFTLKNQNLENEEIILSNKYILIDFWYSYCAPCIAEMPNFLYVYKKFKDKNFTVIGISTDREKDIENWKKTIKDLNIDWKNYWDEKSVFTKKMNIFKFPSNLLLDEKGNIIYQDISSYELDNFLSKKLK